MDNDKKNDQLQLELSEQIAQGIYANLAVITHSKSEFVIDFAQVLPGIPKAMVRSRVILVPEHAKRLLYALQDNIDKYEQMFGSVEEETASHVTGVKGEA